MDPSSDPTASLSPEPVDESAIRDLLGSVVGERYKILGVLGEGGFGIVYEAEQQRPMRRRVALKVLKPGMDSKSVLARFEAERQALAVMDHPNIARVLDGGATDLGHPYFVMELVRGEPITKFCDTHRFGIRERVELLRPVCEAVQHAHSKGVIHRDIKPSNILVEYEGTRPTPKVIDFGVAKAIDQRLSEHTIFTERGQLIGTPEYMSPEQAEMSGLDIDTRTDVYSLGVVLYELLTGLTPFDSALLRKAAFNEIQRIIREVDPPKPSTRLSGFKRLENSAQQRSTIAASRRTREAELEALLRRELDWIVLKCLDKDRERRYSTPQALQEDLQHYLNDEPVDAGPPSTSYRFKKFVKRNRGGVIAASVVLCVLLLGVIGTTSGLAWALRESERATTAAMDAYHAQQAAEERRSEAEAANLLAAQRLRESQLAFAAAEQARQEAEASAEQSLWQAYKLSMGLAGQSLRGGRPGDAAAILSRAPIEHRREDWSLLRAFSSPQGQPLGRLQSIRYIEIAEDNVIAFSTEGEIACFPSGSTTPLWTNRIDQWIHAVAISPSGRVVAVAPWDPHDNASTRVVLFDAVDGRRLEEISSPLIGDGEIFTINKLAFLTEDRLVASAMGTPGFAELRTDGNHRVVELSAAKTSHSHSLALIGEAFQAVLGNYLGYLTAFDSAGQEMWSVREPGSRMLAVAVNEPNGELFAVNGAGVIFRRPLEPEGKLQVFARTNARIDNQSAVALHEGRRLLAVAGKDHTIRVWSTETGALQTAIGGSEGGFNTIRFSGDGDAIIAGCGNGVIIRYPLESTDPVVESLRPTRAMLLPNGGGAVITDDEGGMHLVGPAGVVRRLGIAPGAYRLAYAPNTGRLFVSTRRQNPSGVTSAGWSIEVIESNGDRREMCFIESSDWLNVMVTDEAGEVVVCATEGTTWHAAFDVNSGRKLWEWWADRAPLHGTLVQGSKRCVISYSGAGRGSIGVLDMRTGERLIWSQEWIDWAMRGFIAPDRRTLATGHQNGDVVLWDAVDGAQPRLLGTHNEPIRGLTFSPSSERLFSASERLVCVWDVSTGERLSEFELNGELLTQMSFDTEASSLWLVSIDGTGDDRRERVKRISLPELGKTMATTSRPPERAWQRVGDDVVIMHVAKVVTEGDEVVLHPSALGFSDIAVRVTDTPRIRSRGSGWQGLLAGRRIRARATAVEFVDGSVSYAVSSWDDVAVEFSPREYTRLDDWLGVPRETAATADVTPWRRAGEHLGKPITVQGGIVQVREYPSGRTLLQFDPIVSSGALEIHIPSEGRGLWGPSPRTLFVGRSIRATGVVTLHHNTPQITITLADQLQILDEPDTD